MRAWWALDDGTALLDRDVRRFGRIAVVRGGATLVPTLAAQGPDPFDEAFTPDAFWRALRRSTGGQDPAAVAAPVAGVGNIYADEALWRAGIDPARRSVTRAQAARLPRCVREVLAQGIANGGTTLRDYRTFDGARDEPTRARLLRAPGEPCNRCGTELVARDRRSHRPLPELPAAPLTPGDGSLRQVGRAAAAGEARGRGGARTLLRVLDGSIRARPGGARVCRGRASDVPR